MRYHSTRSAEDFKSFAEVLVSSYAADGGLYVPETLPAISAEKLASMVSYSFPQVCAEVMSWFTDIDLDTLRKMATRAYSSFEPEDVLPIDRVGEVYHLDTSLGPTLSFKDVGQQMVAQVLNHVLGRQQRRATIVVETSGDTGPAAIAGVRGCDNIDIYCLYPHNRVSRVQELQMVTVLDTNVHVYRTEGNTDEQASVLKELFADTQFCQQHNLCSVNSINWARIAAQSSYYLYCYLRLCKRGVLVMGQTINFAVPTGAFGNAMGGYLAQQMGVPIGRILCATNANDVVHRTLSCGDMSVGRNVQTVSPAMDIQTAYNLERMLYYALGQQTAPLKSLMLEAEGEKGVQLPAPLLARVRSTFASVSVTDEQTLKTIAQVREKHGRLLCPHSATAVFAATQPLRYLMAAGAGAEATPTVCVLTAHPAKFEDTIQLATGLQCPIPAAVELLKTFPKRFKTLQKGADQAWRAEWIELLKGDIATGGGGGVGGGGRRSDSSSSTEVASGQEGMCEEGWESMQNQQYQYSVRGVDYQEHRPRFVQDWTEVGSGAGTDAGAGGALLLRIFRHFMTPSLVASVVGALFEADRRWNYLGKGTKKADSSLRGIYKTLAVKIRIYGMQGQGQGQGQGRAKRVRGQGQEGGQGEQGGKGQEQGGQEKGQGKKRSLDRAVEQARVHFEGLRMGALQDRARISKLLARFLLTQSHAAQLSANFQSGLSEVGDYLGGGEKLLSSFQDASDSSSSSSSNSSGSSSSSGAFSDKGVWFQQLVVKLSSGRSYLLHYLLQRREGGEEGRMAEVVEQWGGLVRAKGRAESILAFDGYFADHALRTHLLQQPFAFCASVRQQQFEDVFGMLRDMDGVGGVGRVDRGAGAVGGDRCMHRLQSHETLSYFGDAARGLGKKLCIGNCVRRVRATAVPGAGSSSGAGTSTGADTGAGLLSDTYREAFSQVDAFNAQLHGRKWPHKHGGNGVAGEEGHVDDFAFSALLQNVFNAYEDVCGAGAGLGAGGAGAGAGAGEYAFRPHCLALADALFIHAADGVESDDDV